MKDFCLDEEGSVETGLIMIPVLILFLSVLQLPISLLARVAFSEKLQSQTYLQSFVGTNSGISNNYDQNTNKIALPGGGEIVVKSHRFNVNPITPLLINGDQFNAIGISINENN
jgi:hypothetical protein